MCDCFKLGNLGWVVFEFDNVVWVGDFDVFVFECVLN